MAEGIGEIDKKSWLHTLVGPDSREADGDAYAASSLNWSSRARDRLNLKARLQKWDRELKLNYEGGSGSGLLGPNNNSLSYHQEDDVLSEPESVLSCDSVSGEVKSCWDSGVKFPRWLFPTDRAVPMTQPWTSVEWDVEHWTSKLQAEKDWGRNNNLNLETRGNLKGSSGSSYEKGNFNKSKNNIDKPSSFYNADSTF